ncbi:hypothetical protein [Streptomyces sp. NPDC058307]|uniref:hypothetical protein n=1 Tax=Streptomyces sp. NPDC058307 TaxID=3346439 RepID=UPI0036E47A28
MPWTIGLGQALFVRDTNHIRTAKIREEGLPARETHRGVHDRLHEIAVTVARMNTAETKGS